MNKQKLLMLGFLGIGIYLVATGISYAAFSFIGGTKSTEKANKEQMKLANPTVKPQRRFSLDPSIPLTEVCPLNGEKYSTKEREIWQKRRPLAVMIENHLEARPQSGLSFADVVYEAVAEGGVSRFMAVFYCGISTGNLQVAPVRSARTYFLPWVLEYDALYNHVGGAGNCDDDTVDDRAKALCQIDQYHIKDMDQFGISFPTCFRNYDRLDHAVATEHTMVCQTDKLYALAANKDWTNVDAKGVPWDKNFVPWKFKDDSAIADRGATTSIKFVAWKGYEKDYGVEWIYDKTTNTYKRLNGGVAQKDLVNDEPITAKAVVIQFAKETGPVDDHMHLLYQNIGSGTGLLFQDGKVEKITWQKTERNSRTKFMTENGSEVVFTRGQIWIEMLPTGTTVTY